MICYMVTATYGEGRLLDVKFTSSEVDAKKLRVSLAEKYGINKNTITIEKQDVQTDKTRLIGYLNDLMEKTT